VKAVGIGRPIAGSAILAALCALVLASGVYWSIEPVRVRIVTSARVAAAPLMPVDLAVDDRLPGGPAAFVLRVRAGTTALDLTVALDGHVLTRTRISPGREKRIDASVPVLREDVRTLTITGSDAGWVLESLEMANVHAYAGGPLGFAVVPRHAPSRGAPPVGAVVLFLALLLARPRVDWARHPLRLAHAVAAGAVVVLFAGILLAPAATAVRLLVAAPTFALALVVLYARPLWLASTRLLSVEGAAAPAREVAPLPRPAELLAAAAGFCALVAVFLHEQVRDFYSVPDFGDPLFSIWRIAWVVHQVWADPRHLFDANIFYPEPGTLTYSDSIILPALTALPLLKLGVHPLATYNLLLLSAFALSGLATYVFARGIGFSRGAAWVSGVLFVVFPYRLDHYPHLELQMAHWMPLGLLGIHRVMATGRWRWVGLTALLIGAQWYSSMYYALFLSVYLAVFALVLALAWRQPRRLALAACAVVAGVALAVPLARAYSGSAAARGERPVEEIELFSAAPGDYLQPNSRSAHYGDLQPRGTPERELFPGVGPLVLAAAGAWPPWTPTRAAMLAGGLVAFDGSLGLNGVLYPWMYDWLSPVRSLRVPARFAILVGLTLALFGGAAIDRWRASAGRRVPPAALAALATLGLVAEAWPSLRLIPLWREPPPLYGALGPASGAVLMEYPMSPDPPFFTENLPFLYFSAWHLTPMVNGYSGFMSERYLQLAPATRGFPGGETIQILRRAGVTHISVICALDGPIRPLGQRSYDPWRCGPTVVALDADPRLRAVVRSVWQGAPALLYEIQP
jgi:hypothetical protein